MIFNFIFPFSDFLYILQQEEYSSQRYWKWLGRFFFRRGIQKRGRLKYTPRTKITLCFVIFVWLIAIILTFLLFKTGILLPSLLIIAWIITIPLFVLIGNFILNPLFVVAKRRVVKKASDKIARYKNLKVIAVAGSFGKTTTKNFIYELIRYNYKTQLIPENINTTLGIANWVNIFAYPTAEVLIVEMDAYQRGEIKESCSITPPDIAIITNIGDQHLERFSQKKELAQTLGEVFTYSKPSAQLLCDSNAAKELPVKEKYNLTSVGFDNLKILTAHPNILARFSSSNLINLAFAMKTAELLGISDEFIIDTCRKLEPPDRRQKMVVLHNYDCVDDSYNISFTTARAGILFAKNAAVLKKKKLLVVTAGIPELGPKDQDKNEALGKILAEKADHVALLKSIFFQEIAKGISDEKKYTAFKNLQEFLEESKELFPPEEWLILLQPELTDLYY
jgi:UDP-N-acetylmuramoyl-tripeptide--D-alanyl-D-alanine ligase